MMDSCNLGLTFVSVDQICGVIIQMKPFHQYFNMVLFIQFVILALESVDKLLWCDHPKWNETSSAVFSVFYCNLEFLSNFESSQFWKWKGQQTQTPEVRGLNERTHLSGTVSRQRACWIYVINAIKRAAKGKSKHSWESGMNMKRSRRLGYMVFRIWIRVCQTL